MPLQLKSSYFRYKNTCLPETGPNVKFLLSLDKDLYVITKSTSDIEPTKLQILSYESNYQIIKYATDLPIFNTAKNHEFILLQRNKDLFVIKYAGTASNMTEVIIFTPRDGYKQIFYSGATPLPQTSANFSYELNHQGHLFAIQKNGTRTHKTEVQILSNPSKYTKSILKIATVLPESDNTDQFFFSVFTKEITALKPNRAPGENLKIMKLLSAGTHVPFQKIRVQDETEFREDATNFQFVFDQPSEAIWAIKHSNTNSKMTEINIIYQDINKFLETMLPTIIVEKDKNPDVWRGHIKKNSTVGKIDTFYVKLFDENYSLAKDRSPKMEWDDPVVWIPRSEFAIARQKVSNVTDEKAKDDAAIAMLSFDKFRELAKGIKSAEKSFCNFNENSQQINESYDLSSSSSFQFPASGIQITEVKINRNIRKWVLSQEQSMPKQFSKNELKVKNEDIQSGLADMSLQVVDALHALGFGNELTRRIMPIFAVANFIERYNMNPDGMTVPHKAACAALGFIHESVHPAAALDIFVAAVPAAIAAGPETGGASLLVIPIMAALVNDIILNAGPRADQTQRWCQGMFVNNTDMKIAPTIKQGETIGRFFIDTKPQDLVGDYMSRKYGEEFAHLLDRASFFVPSDDNSQPGRIIEGTCTETNNENTTATSSTSSTNSTNSTNSTSSSSQERKISTAWKGYELPPVKFSIHVEGSLSGNNLKETFQPLMTDLKKVWSGEVVHSMWRTAKKAGKDIEKVSKKVIKSYPPTHAIFGTIHDIGKTLGIKF